MVKETMLAELRTTLPVGDHKTHPAVRGDNRMKKLPAEEAIEPYIRQGDTAMEFKQPVK